MGNAAVAGERAEIDALDELYQLNASESEPEPEPEDDDDADGEDEGDEGFEPEDMPHP